MKNQYKVTAGYSPFHLKSATDSIFIAVVVARVYFLYDANIAFEIVL